MTARTTEIGGDMGQFGVIFDCKAYSAAPDIRISAVQNIDIPESVIAEYARNHMKTMFNAGRPPPPLSASAARLLAIGMAPVNEGNRSLRRRWWGMGR